MKSLYFNDIVPGCLLNESKKEYFVFITSVTRFSDSRIRDKIPRLKLSGVLTGLDNKSGSEFTTLVVPDTEFGRSEFNKLYELSNPT